MRRVFTLALPLLVAMALRSMADPWSLAGCRPEDQPAYDDFARAVRTASPGSTVYVPKPYPTTVPQVVQDFLYQYKSFHFEQADPKKLLPGELPLLNGILNSTVTFTVQKVANWTSARCGKEQRRDFYHLVRVFDAASGAELSRATLSPSGLLSARDNATGSSPFPPLPDPAVAMQEVSASYGTTGEAPQYVTTLGPIYCAFTEPCLAFRQGKDAYIYLKHPRFKSALFKIASDEPRLVLAPGEHLESALARGGIAPQRTDGTERLVPLGANTWTVAREVKASPVAPRP
jgi:hypothetical protein